MTSVLKSLHFLSGKRSILLGFMWFCFVVVKIRQVKRQELESKASQGYMRLQKEGEKKQQEDRKIGDLFKCT